MRKLEIRDIISHAVGPINLSVDAGQCVCLSGPSGSGKTLLLRAIADLDPHGGTALLDGKECEHFIPFEWRRRVGLLPAESAWWDDTVGQHYARDGQGWLAQLGFETDVLGWEVSRLSTGERQRLALGRLLTNRPEVLLLDEPTASLDSDNVGRVEELLRDYRTEHDAAILWVTHEDAQVARVAELGFRIVDGRIEDDNAS